jgi:hypothetical protein
MNTLTNIIRRRRRSIGFASVMSTLAIGAHAASVTNWVIDQGSPVTFGLDTNSPTIGDGSPENADQVILHATFPTVALSNNGDAILLTGSVTLFGITATDTGTNQQLRFGLFDMLGSPGTSGWLGYFVANSTAANAGVVRQRNAGNVDLFISNNGSTIVASTANPPNSRTGATITNDTYGFSLQLTRDGNNFDIAGALFGGPGGNFFDSFTLDDLAPTGTETFTFNTVGFLLGNAMNVDQAQYNNVDVTFIPEPAACILLALGCLLSLRRGRKPANGSVGCDM